MQDNNGMVKLFRLSSCPPSSMMTPWIPRTLPVVAAAAASPHLHHFHCHQYTPGIIGLHEEIEDFYEWMVPTEAEHINRLEVVRRIRDAILEMWPHARVEVFGSFRTGLFLPNSDIDLVILGHWSELPLRTIERILIEKGIAEPDNVKVLEKAAVPIVKLRDSRSDINVDISFNMVNGIRAAELIKHYKKRFPPLAKLIYVLKQFLLQRDLNEVFTGGLSSYALILMVVSFLQLHPREEVSSSKANIGVLLIEFLELYGRNLNYLQTAIRITDGGSYIPKNDFYKSLTDGHRPGILSIEDPLDATNDVGRSSYGFMNVQRTFQRAYAILTSVISLPERSYLNSIISISPNVADYRRWVNMTFQPFMYDYYPSFQTVIQEPDENRGRHHLSSTSDTDSEGRSSVMSISPANSDGGNLVTTVVSVVSPCSTKNETENHAVRNNSRSWNSRQSQDRSDKDWCSSPKGFANSTNSKSSSWKQSKNRHQNGRRSSDGENRSAESNNNHHNDASASSGGGTSSNRTSSKLKKRKKGKNTEIEISNRFSPKLGLSKPHR